MTYQLSARTQYVHLKATLITTLMASRVLSSDEVRLRTMIERAGATADLIIEEAQRKVEDPS